MGDDNADNFKDALPTNQQECSTSAKSMQPPDTVAEASRTDDLSISSPSTPNLNGTTSSINAEPDRVFTLFPKLSTELCRMVWKNVLPGPRVVQYCLRELRDRVKKIIEKSCSAVNSTIEITCVCHESLSVVQPVYKKLIVTLNPSSPISLGEKQPFVYVDYNIDAVYLELNYITPEVHSKLFPYLCNVKQFTMLEHDFQALETQKIFWYIVRVSCPLLEHITFVAQWCQNHYEYGYEWALVYFPANRAISILPDYEHAFSPERAILSDRVGILKFMAAEARELAEKIESYIERYPEWKGVSFDVALRARRRNANSCWKTHYLPYDCHNSFEIEDDEEFECDRHWHTEPIQLGDGTLFTCDFVQDEVPDEDLCSQCGEQRWKNGKDAL